MFLLFSLFSSFLILLKNKKWGKKKKKKKKKRNWVSLTTVESKTVSGWVIHPFVQSSTTQSSLPSFPLSISSFPLSIPSFPLSILRQYSEPDEWEENRIFWSGSRREEKVNQNSKGERRRREIKRIEDQDFVLHFKICSFRKKVVFDLFTNCFWFTNYDWLRIDWSNWNPFGLFQSISCETFVVIKKKKEEKEEGRRRRERRRRKCFPFRLLLSVLYEKKLSSLKLSSLKLSCQLVTIKETKEEEVNNQDSICFGFESNEQESEREEVFKGRIFVVLFHSIRDQVKCWLTTTDN